MLLRGLTWLVLFQLLGTALNVLFLTLLPGPIIGMLLLFAFLVVSIAVAVLRRTKPRMKRPFRTPAVPLLPMVSALCCLGLMAALSVETWLRFLVWLVIGLVIYLGYGRRHSNLATGRDAMDDMNDAEGTGEVG